MKKILLLAIPFFYLSCYTAKQAAEDNAKNKAKKIRHEYEFSMIQPYENNSLYFEDSAISAQFNIGDKEIDFKITNKTQHILKLVWDEASIGVFNKSHKIMHTGVKYIDKGNSSTPSTILPNTILDDEAIPADNIYYSEGSSSYAGNWETKKLLLPIGKKISTSKKMIGQLITLYLPIVDNRNENIGYTFQFKIIGISGINN